MTYIFEGPIQVVYSRPILSFTAVEVGDRMSIRFEIDDTPTSQDDGSSTWTALRAEVTVTPADGAPVMTEVFTSLPTAIDMAQVGYYPTWHYFYATLLDLSGEFRCDAIVEDVFYEGGSADLLSSSDLPLDLDLSRANDTFGLRLVDARGGNNEGFVGFTDSVQIIAGAPDTDGDGLLDDEELHVYGTDPDDADTDDDNLGDGDEVLTHGTDPLNPDSDGDTLLDGDEVAGGTDPLVFDDITPPTADAGPDQIVQAGDNVDLDGSASYDDTSGTDDLSFLWGFSSIPAGSTATLSGETTQTPSFGADLPGVYVVDLVVTDEAGLVSVPDSVTISSVNVPPTADAGDDVTVILDQTAVLDGLGSSDPDGDPITYQWTLTGAPSGSMTTLVGDTSANPTLAPDLAGEYTVELVVNDGFEDAIAAEVVVTGITAGDFAKDKVRETMDFVRSLPKSAFDRRGHKRALLRQLRHVLRDLNRGKTFHAAFKLQWWVLPRVDGVTLRGAVDPKGRWWQWWRTKRADWIVDETAQVQVYDGLKEAVDALCS